MLQLKQSPFRRVTLRRMMKSLTVLERLILPSVLPAKGKFLELTVKDEITNLCKFTSEEVEAIELKQNEKGMTWDQSKAQDKEVELTDTQVSTIKKALKEMDEKGELTSEHMSLFKKFAE